MMCEPIILKFSSIEYMLNKNLNIFQYVKHLGRWNKIQDEIYQGLCRKFCTCIFKCKASQVQNENDVT